MKIVCEQCGETSDAASVRLDDGVVLLTCSSCGVENRLEPTDAADHPKEAPNEPAHAAAEDSLEVGPEVEPDESAIESQGEEGDDNENEDEDGDGSAPKLAPHKCPKCFHRQHQDDFCERCGLDLTSAEASPERWENSPDWLKEEIEEARKLWADVERTPRLERLHEAFIEYCVENRLLEFAVRRYRARLADRPNEQPTSQFAKTAVDKLEVFALAKIATDNWSKDLSQRVQLARKALFVVAVILVVVGFVLLVFVFRDQGTLLPSDP